MGKEDEGILTDDGTEGSSTGYMKHGDYDPDAEEESLSDEGEPGEEVDELEAAKEELEDEEEPEEEEEEPGDEEEEEDEFLVKEVSPELVEERKALQRAYSEKFQELGALRLRANLVDAIDKSPEETLKALAKRYGVDLGEAKAEAELDIPEVDIAPKEDEELPAYVARLNRESLKGIPKMIKDAVQSAIGDTSGATEAKLEKGKIQATLKYLGETYPDWGIYEERMIELVQKHPSLRNDPDELYKLAKGSPAQISAKSKAARTKAKVKSPKSGERGKKAIKLATKKGKIMSFDEAWATAKAELRGGK